MRRVIRLPAVALLCAVGLGGCGLPGVGGGGAPATGQTASATAAGSATVAGSATAAGSAAGPGTTAAAPASKLAVARRTHEYPGRPARQTAPSGSAGPVFVIEAFATAYINWTAATVTRTMRALTQISVGQARSEVSLAAAQTAQDYELKRGGIANAGVVEAIAPVAGHRDQYAVVTRERTTSTNTNAYQGLAPAWHLALATVTRLRPGQWVLSVWQPES
jgi:hypothetical protein